MKFYDSTAIRLYPKARERSFIPNDCCKAYLTVEGCATGVMLDLFGFKTGGASIPKTSHLFSRYRRSSNGTICTLLTSARTSWTAG